MIEYSQPQKHSWLLAAGLIAFLISAGFSLSFEWRASSLHRQITALNNAKEAAIQPAADGTENISQSIAQSFLAQKELAVIEKSQLPWAAILEKIEATIPLIPGTKTPIVEFRSYTGSEEGKISVSAATKADAADPLIDVASLLQAFSAEPAFTKVFVPSLTKSLAPSGETVVSFSLNFNYQKPR